MHQIGEPERLGGGYWRWGLSIMVEIAQEIAGSDIIAEPFYLAKINYRIRCIITLEHQRSLRRKRLKQEMAGVEGQEQPAAVVGCPGANENRCSNGAPAEG